MHLISHLTCLLDSLNLLWLLGGTHLHHCLDELERCSFLLLIGMYAEKVHYLYHCVVAVGRQEMNLALALEGILNDSSKSLHRQCVGHSHLCGEVADRVNRAIPYDIYHINVVAHKSLAVVVDVNNTHKAFAVLTEIIDERRILSVGIICIGRIIHRRLIVAEE